MPSSVQASFSAGEAVVRPLVNNRFIVLDGVRGFAALVVASFHFSNNHLFPHGFLAVDLFFALSGFVLMHVYGNRTITAWGFAVLRLIRLYPMYAFGLLLGFLAYFGEPGTAFSFLLGAFFIPHPHGHLYPINEVSWSLVDEIAVNIIFGYMLARRIPIVWLLVASVTIGAGVVLFVPHLRHLNGGWTADTWSIGVLRAAYSFSVGALLYRVAMRLPPINGWLLIAGILVVFSLPDISRSAIVSPLAIVFGVPFTVLAGSSAYVDRWSMRLFEWLGGISYALYAIHRAVFHVIERLFGDALGPLIAGMIVSIILAHVLTAYVDPPARRWLSSFNKPRALRPA
jgi:peptidoglycan/LPS O-acetylase OafA/YrhL